MKKLFFIALVLSGFAASSQGIKISALPTYTGSAGPTGWIPISIGSTTYKIDPSLVSTPGNFDTVFVYRAIGDTAAVLRGEILAATSSLPLSQIGFGTGTSITSTPYFTWDSTNHFLDVYSHNGGSRFIQYWSPYYASTDANPTFAMHPRGALTLTNYGPAQPTLTLDNPANLNQLNLYINGHGGGVGTSYGTMQAAITGTSSETGLYFNNTNTGGISGNIFTTSNSSDLGAGHMVLGDITNGRTWLDYNSTGNNVSIPNLGGSGTGLVAVNNNGTLFFSSGASSTFYNSDNVLTNLISSQRNVYAPLGTGLIYHNINDFTILDTTNENNILENYYNPANGNAFFQISNRTTGNPTLNLQSDTLNRSISFQVQEPYSGIPLIDASGSTSGVSVIIGNSNNGNNLIEDNNGTFILSRYSDGSSTLSQDSTGLYGWAEGTNTWKINDANGQPTFGAYSLPYVDGSAGQVLTTNGSGIASWQSSGSGGTPGGSNQQIQYNNSGAFAGSPVLTFDGSNFNVLGGFLNVGNSGNSSGFTLDAAGSGFFEQFTNANNTAFHTETFPNTDFTSVANVNGHTANTSGTVTIPNATTSITGLLTSTDWNTFNGKQAALSGTGYVKMSGTTPSYISAIPYTDLTGTPTIPTAFYLGTTSINLNRSSGSLSVTGLSIDGNAGTVTNGLYSTGSYSNPSWLTGVPYSILTGTVPTWNQNTTGTAANITASSNSTLTTLSALSLPYSQLTGTPTGVLLANGSVPLTANWPLGAYYITSTQTAATANTIYRGIGLTNTTAATSGNLQIAPSIYSSTNGYGGSTSQAVTSNLYLTSQTGTTFSTNPTPKINIDMSLNGGSSTTVAAIYKEPSTANGLIGVQYVASSGTQPAGFVVAPNTFDPTNVSGTYYGGMVWSGSTLSVLQANGYNMAVGAYNSIYLPAYDYGAVIAGTSWYGTLTVNGNIATAITTKSSSYLIAATDSKIIVTASSTITLPTAVGCNGRSYRIIIPTGVTVTMATTLSQTANGTTPPIITSTTEFTSDGANWWY